MVVQNGEKKALAFSFLNHLLFSASLILQVLSAVRTADSLPQEEHRQEVLKVLLSLSCHSGWRMDGRRMVELMALCLAMYGAGGNATKAAAQATCSQNILEYCKELSKQGFFFASSVFVNVFCDAPFQDFATG